MEARNLTEPASTPIQLSLRIRHPAIDPQEISKTLGLEPEYCFKAGDARRSGAKARAVGQHTQTYWLAPIVAESLADAIEPQFLAAIAARNPGRDPAVTVELQAGARDLMFRNVEGLLLLFLQRLNTRHAFLQGIQSGGGDVALIMVIERESAADFTLPVTLTRLFVRLGISIEIKFDS